MNSTTLLDAPTVLHFVHCKLNCKVCPLWSCRPEPALQYVLVMKSSRNGGNRFQRYPPSQQWLKALAKHSGCFKLSCHSCWEVWEPWVDLFVFDPDLGSIWLRHHLTPNSHISWPLTTWDSCLCAAPVRTRGSSSLGGRAQRNSIRNGVLINPMLLKLVHNLTCFFFWP